MPNEIKNYTIADKIYFVGDLTKEGFVVKGKIVSDIIRDYNSYTIKLSMIAEYKELCENEVPYANDKVKENIMIVFIKYIKLILDQMSKDNREIIMNEYVMPKENWWVKKYKRSTFFRCRLEAVSEFLEYVF